MSQDVELYPRDPAFIVPMGPNRFKEIVSGLITALTRSVLQQGVDIVDDVEVERLPGSDNELVPATVPVMWTETKVTIIRSVANGESAPEHVLTHFEEMMEAFLVGGNMHSKVEHQVLHDQWESLVSWAHVGFGGMAGPVLEGWP
jgi:hypothetical protein